MMKMWKKMIALFSAACVLTACGASDTASDDQLTQIQEKGVIVIGTEGTYAPNSYHDEDGNLTGFDVEVGRLIARELGVEAQFVESSWDSLFAAMDSGRVDTVINEVEADEERAEKYDFSQPYTYVHGALMVSSDNTDIQGFADLDGMRAAQNLTSSWGALAESYGAQLVGVDSMDQSIQLLESGRADATLNSETAFGDYLRKHPDAPVKIAARTETTTSSVVPVRKGNEALREAIDDALDALRASGELSELSQRFFGMDVTQE